MSLADFKLMLDILRGREVRRIDIMGGEPTLHPDILSLVRESLLVGFLVNISSNGTNLNLLEEIMLMGSGVTVGISVNDRATFEHAREFIETYKPMVKSVFHPTIRLGMIREILALKPKKYYLIYRDALSRSGLQMTTPFPLFSSMIEQWFDLTDVGTVFCSGFLPDIKQCPELARVRCPAGTAKLGVLPDGSVFPCNLFFGKKEFLLGNVVRDPFQDIWQHRTLDFFRSSVTNLCTQISCRHHAECHGGCPAHSLYLTDDLTAPDPRCTEI